MLRLLPAVVLASATFLLACGGPSAGDGCSKTGFLCQDVSTALECRAGKWTALPCRGPQGCTKDGDAVKCDMSGDQAGDYCASTAEGKGLCTVQGTATLECRQGTLVQTNTCTSCTVSGDQVQCQR